MQKQLGALKRQQDFAESTGRLACKGRVHFSCHVTANADVHWLAVSDGCCYCIVQQTIGILQMNDLSLHQRLKIIMINTLSSIARCVQ